MTAITSKQVLYILLYIFVYYIIVITVDGKKMHEGEMKICTLKNNKLPSEESHPVTVPVGENMQKKSCKKHRRVLKSYHAHRMIINIIC